MIERRFADEDLPSLLDLLRSSYGGWHSTEYWMWKYKENPHGQPVIWVAEDKGKIVGCYILNPVKIQLGQTSVVAAQSVDAAVDIACRGGGLFKKLAVNTLAQATKENVVVTFAFPTTIAFKGQIRIGYRSVFVLPKVYKILHLERLLEDLQFRGLSLRKASRILEFYARIGQRKACAVQDEKLAIKRISSFDSRFKVFWERICKENIDILIERDLDYLNWRYFRHPEKSYAVYACEEDGEIVGYSVLSVERNASTQRDKSGRLSIGNIIDLLTLPGNSQAKRSLISRSLNYFERENVDIARCWMFNRHPYYAMFRKLGFSEYYELFRRALFRPKYIDQFIIYVNSKAALLKALESNQTRSHWFIMQGDADYT